MQPIPPTCRLTGAQKTRLALAEHDLIQARGLDLAATEPAMLIVTIERLRGSLDDLVQLARELLG